MMKIITLCLICLLVIRIDCQQPFVLDIDNQTGNFLKYSDIFSVSSIIPLETKRNCVIGQISQIDIVNDTIYVLDNLNSKALFVFLGNGKFVRKIGSLGKGPGEYLNPTSFFVSQIKNQILINDFSSNKINVYKKNGEYIKQIKINKEFRARNISSKNDLIFIDNRPTDYNDGYILKIINENGEILKSLFHYSEYNKGWNTVLYHKSPSVFQANNEVKFVDLFMDTVFLITENKTLPYFIIKHDNKLSKNKLRDIQKSMIQENKFNFTEIIFGKYFFGINNYLENERFVYFKYYNNSGNNTILYNKNKNKANWIGKNDLLGVQTDLFKISNSNIFGIFSNGYSTVNDIKEKINNNKIKLSQQNKSVILKLNINSNPFLVKYEINSDFYDK